jgi:hypothetical protein
MIPAEYLLDGINISAPYNINRIDRRKTANFIYISLMELSQKNQYEELAAQKKLSKGSPGLVE